MRRKILWIPIGIVVAVSLAVWGVWTWRVNAANHGLALLLEAERQRSFSEMVYHVEQIQALMGKGLAAGGPRQNMRYMGDAYHHAQSAVSNFTSLPLPAEMQASTGKFLQQTGDFAAALLRNEAAGREMTLQTRAELARLQRESQTLGQQLQTIAAQYNQGGFRWNPPAQLSWASLLGRAPAVPGKPATGAQAPSSLIPGGWEQIGSAMETLPVLLYDGPFSDHVGKRAPAMSGPVVNQEEAARRLRSYLPAAQWTVAGVSEVGGSLPSYSFRMAPTGGAPDYTAFAEITKHGGHLLQFLNSRMVGKPTLDLARARTIGQAYLASIGYTGMGATYGQAEGGSATIAYAYRENEVVVYPDQIKVKVALDTGEILAVDARQYLMTHHHRTLGKPEFTPEQAGEALNPELAVQRVQLALIPDQSGTGEILVYEFLTALGDQTYLVYINANTGMEEQILQQVETDGGTFVL